MTETPIFFQLKVLDIDDPLMLGRIRGIRLIDNYNDIINSITSPSWNPDKDKWTDRDPFIFNPLLPYFIYQVPKVDELVQCIYVNKNFTYENQYYIQNTFSSPTSTNYEYNYGSNKFTGTGNQIKNPKELKNRDGSYTNKELHKGVFPEPSDNAILGRGSADLVLKEDEVLMRAGKFIGSKLTSNVIPVANQQRAFFQLSRFQSTTEKLEDKKVVEINEKVVLAKHLIEWTIRNPENTLDVFSGTIFLYKLKPDRSVNSENLTIGSNISNNLKSLIHFENFDLLSKDNVITFINDFIKRCNETNVSKNGDTLFSSDDEKFPIFYRPNNLMYSYVKPTTQLGKYKSVGVKECVSGSCNLTIKILKSDSNEIIINKTKSGSESDLSSVYNELIISVNQEIDNLEIGLVKLPTIDEFTNVELYFEPNVKTTISNNLNYIINKIKLNPGLKIGGYGLIYTKDKVGKPLDFVKKTLPNYKAVTNPTTYGSLGADKLLLLSHKSTIPSKGKINFDDTLYGISPEKFTNEIMPKTSSLVRGEELMELLNLIVRFLLTHTHSFPGNPPIGQTYEGVSSLEILKELQNAYNKILNKNIRIN